MTSREWRSDRRAVFERDGYTCCNCSSVGGDDEPTAVRTYPVGDVPLEGTVHASSLVTVCSRCFSLLQTSTDDSGGGIDRNELFRIIRRATRKQGPTISDAAAFASHVTSLPTALEGDDDPATAYLETRREVLLALDIVDAHLSRIETHQTATLDQAIETSLAAFSEQAMTLQSELRTIVELSETVLTGLGRCHGCFEPFESDSSGESGPTPEPCRTCGLESRPLSDWRRSGSDSALAFDRLFATINDRLQESSETTDALTDRTMALAAALADE